VKSKFRTEEHVPTSVHNCSEFNQWLEETILYRESRNNSISESLIFDESKMKHCVNLFTLKKLSSSNIRGLYDYSDNTLDDIRIYKDKHTVMYYNSDPRGKHRDVHFVDHKL
jgi:hypothetical protein